MILSDELKTVIDELFEDEIERLALPAEKERESSNSSYQWAHRNRLARMQAARIDWERSKGASQ